MTRRGFLAGLLASSALGSSVAMPKTMWRVEQHPLWWGDGVPTVPIQVIVGPTHSWTSLAGKFVCPSEETLIALCDLIAPKA